VTGSRKGRLSCDSRTIADEKLKFLRAFRKAAAATTTTTMTTTTTTTATHNYGNYAIPASKRGELRSSLERGVCSLAVSQL